MKESRNYIITDRPCESIYKFSVFYSSHYHRAINLVGS